MRVMIVNHLMATVFHFDPSYRNRLRQVIVNQGEPPPLNSAS